MTRAAAVVGERGTFDDIQALAELDPPPARQALERLRAAAILVPGSWAFVHPLVKEAVLSSGAPSELAPLHRIAAHWLRERGAPPAGHRISASDSRVDIAHILRSRSAVGRGVQQASAAADKR